MLRQLEAKEIGNQLLHQYGLAEWQIQFNKSPNHLGQCWHQTKVIAVSVYLLNSCTETEFRDTMLHEIAHALVGPGHGHNQTWVDKAKSIGCTAMECGHFYIDQSRATSLSETKPKVHIKPITNVCPKCGATAIEESRAKFPKATFIKLKCGHLIQEEQLASSSFSFETWKSESGKMLYPYQLEGAKFIERANGRALIADEPALGKTVQALSFLKGHGDIALPAIWICKSKLKIQAVKESLDWCGIDYFPCVIDSSKSFIMPGLKIYIISMDLLRRMPQKKFEEIGAKTLIFDEVQHIKNPDSSRTQEVRRLVNNMDFVIFLSGTPWKNRGSEYFSALNMLSPERFPSYQHFKNKWVDVYWDKKTGKYREGGIKNIPAFREYTKDIVLRRMRDDVLPDLPPTNRNIRYVELEDIYGEAYEKAEDTVAAIVKDILLEGRSMASLAAEMMKLKHITGLAKVDAQVDDAIEFLEETEDWQKLTIFHHHIDVGDELERKLNVWLTANGYDSALRIRGGMDAWDSNALLERFKNRETSRILIASTLASGEGLNIQFCQNASMMERQWNPANEEQAELRFSRPMHWQDIPEYLQEHLFNDDRKPKKVSIRIPYLVCAGTIDEMLTEIVERKRHNFNKSMNVRDENLTWEENDIMQELAEAIVRKKYGKKR